MDEISLPLGSMVPGNAIPPELYTVINDLYVALFSLVEQLNRQNGIAKSPNGHYWRVDVDNSGLVTTTDLGLVLPP